MWQNFRLIYTSVELYTDSMPVYALKIMCFALFLCLFFFRNQNKTIYKNANVPFAFKTKLYAPHSLRHS